MVLRNRQFWVFFAAIVIAPQLFGAEITRLTSENIVKLAPAGKEADAIIGDYLLQSDRLLVVVADCLPTRKANMTTPKVGGCVIDLTLRDKPNDQLTCYYPGGALVDYVEAETVQATGPEVVLRVKSRKTSTQTITTYRLADGSPTLAIDREIRNTADKEVTAPLMDSIRCDGPTFSKSPLSGNPKLFWAADNWFEQAYGVIAGDCEFVPESDNRRSTIFLTKTGKRTVKLAPNVAVTVAVRLCPATNVVGLKAVAADLAAVRTFQQVVRATDPNGDPVVHALVTLTEKEKEYGVARTNDKGEATLRLPAGEFGVKVASVANGAGSAKLNVQADGETAIKLELAAKIAVEVQDAGKPTPCKLQFLGRDGTPDPKFGPNNQGPAVNNLYYSHNGNFSLDIPPGKYHVLISKGTEYDLIEKDIDARPGLVASLSAALKRTVHTPGWVSSDIHSHSTPSGDNATTMHGRVLNLLAEHIEFAPCTEHNRIDTYLPVLKALNCLDEVGTCSGMELTGETLPLNHQNAFPMLLRPWLQDNGAPTIDPNPEVQIAKLARWDNNSEKLIQQNHPDLGWMYFDRNGDGIRDGGYAEMFPFQHVIEIWGNDKEAMIDESIYATQPITARGRNNRLINWMQLLNQGRRIVAVVNTDAHYTDHGTGWCRNYVKSSTDVPSKISTMEMVREYKAGHVVMTNGPYLETSFRTGAGVANPGDSIVAANGVGELHVRVQCANWYDINRVTVFVSGRASESWNYTRKSHPDKFKDGSVKFDEKIPIKLEKDSHLIVVATGEGLGFGKVWGPEFEKSPPLAIANPFYVDVDGQGYSANGDTLGHPLPVKAPGSGGKATKKAK